MKSDKARLLPVGERAAHLFGKDEGREPPRRKKTAKQRSLFDEANEDDGAAETWTDLTMSQAGATVLDRLHQAMILFGAGRGEALKRFLVEEGAGRDQRFWRLAQACRHCILRVPKRNAGWTACLDGRRGWDYKHGEF